MPYWSVRRLAALALIPALIACMGGGPVGDSPTASSSLAFVGVGVADGTTPEPRQGWTVVVRDGRIAAAGPSSSVRVPDGTTVIDGAGRYLVPGLWDMHVHLNDRDARWLPLLVAHGVTSVRDLGALRAADAERMRREVIGHGLPVPQIATAGFVVETPGSLAFMERLATGAAATGHPTPRWHRGRLIVTTAAAAHSRGLVLVGHAPQALRWASPWQALDAGQRSFEHGWGFARALDTMPAASRLALAARMREREAAFVPTLLVSGQDAIPTDRFWTLVNDSVGEIDPRNRWISAQERTQWAARLRMLRTPERSARWLAGWQRSYDRESAALRELHRLGVPILPGSDLGMYLVYPGSSLHEELALLTQKAGMTPFEALRATFVSALGGCGGFGWFHPGWAAGRPGAARCRPARGRREPGASQRRNGRGPTPRPGGAGCSSRLARPIAEPGNERIAADLLSTGPVTDLSCRVYFMQRKECSAPH